MAKSRPRVSRRVSLLVREAVEGILRRVEPKPSLIVLFGSEARREATPESDIDLLVVLESDDPETVKAVREAVYEVMWKHDFERLISVITFPKEMFEEQKAKGYSFVKNVEREGIVLWQAA